MLKLFNGTTHQIFNKDVEHFARFLDIPNRSKTPLFKLFEKVQETIVADENLSKIAEEYLIQNATQKMENKTLGRAKAKQTLADPKTIDLSLFVGKYFKAQASYMVSIYKVVGHTAKRLRVSIAKTNFTGTVHYPQYTIDESYDPKNAEQHLVKLDEYDGSYSFKHSDFTYFEVNAKDAFSCCEY